MLQKIAGFKKRARADMISIRKEGSYDPEGIKTIYHQGFGNPTEGRIMEMLRKSCPCLLSLVVLKEIGLWVIFSSSLLESMDQAAMKCVSGVARYRYEFDEAM